VPPPGELAAQIVSVLGERGQTLATAESLTGGLLGAAVTAVPGASMVYRGGIIASAAMAAGARDRLGATWGLATTGVAGPDPADGFPPGTVHIAASAGSPATRSLALAGDRDRVRRDTVDQALQLLFELLREDAS
jgi:nicotinamide-nucleotide amidase